MIDDLRTWVAFDLDGDTAMVLCDWDGEGSWLWASLPPDDEWSERPELVTFTVSLYMGRGDHLKGLSAEQEAMVHACYARMKNPSTRLVEVTGEEWLFDQRGPWMTARMEQTDGGHLRRAMSSLITMYTNQHEESTEDVDLETDALRWVMDEVWMLRSENRDLRIASWKFPSQDRIESVDESNDDR